ncbi:DUF2470 domain-containing protein [Kitasatospora cathayae]|uniref:DUF2470 domain-containing protein n=1 Tax=Kitasatospora cathayae TaxID=3004092 RepID=UPI0038602DF0
MAVLLPDRPGPLEAVETTWVPAAAGCTTSGAAPRPPRSPPPCSPIRPPRCWPAPACCTCPASPPRSPTAAWPCCVPCWPTAARVGWSASTSTGAPRSGRNATRPCCRRCWTPPNCCCSAPTRPGPTSAPTSPPRCAAVSPPPPPWWSRTPPWWSPPPPTSPAPPPTRWPATRPRCSPHLADGHADALGLLTGLLDPALLTHHPDVRPLALDRHGLVLRLDHPHSHRDVRLVFPEPACDTEDFGHRMHELLTAAQHGPPAPSRPPGPARVRRTRRTPRPP